MVKTTFEYVACETQCKTSEAGPGQHGVLGYSYISSYLCEN